MPQPCSKKHRHAHPLRRGWEPVSALLVHLAKGKALCKQRTWLHAASAASSAAQALGVASLGAPSEQGLKGALLQLSAPIDAHDCMRASPAGACASPCAVPLFRTVEYA